MPKLRAIDATGGDGFVAALRAAWDEGDAVLPVDTRLPPAARERLLERLGAGQPVEAGDAVVVATSGTTGDPKGVVLTHDAVRASAVAISERLLVDPAADTWLACLPLSHVGALAVVMRSVVTQTRVIVHDGFDPAAAMSSGATLTALVPTALQRIDPARFRLILLGGSTLPPVVPPNAVATYGMTETGSGIVYDGLPLDGVEVKIVDGEIVVRCPMLLRCYRSADGERDPRDADGWFATGDSGSFDGDGRLVVDGRMTDMIITGGENVWPAPIEDALRTHPGVADVAVAGRPDAEWGERVVAYVIPIATATPPSLDDLRAVVKETLPAFCAPKELVLVESLPRTAIGKVQRGALP